MDVVAHFRSITSELEAVRDRVRNFSVAAPHWPTAGEWKESVLRVVLKGHLPAHVEPLRGFVVSPTRGSGQIDVLLYDNRKPVLFRNGDLVFVTPDAVAGIVEVKSRVSSRTMLRDALRKLGDDAEMIRSRSDKRATVFVGLFAYESDLSSWQAVLEEVADASHGQPDRIVTHLCLGCSHFTRFWQDSPTDQSQSAYNRWHAYELHNQSAGYFISNLVESVARESVAGNEDLWFPAVGKEFCLLGTRGLPPNLGLQPTADGASI